MVFFLQAGHATHDEVLRSIDLIGEKVIPRFANLRPTGKARRLCTSRPHRARNRRADQDWGLGDGYEGAGFGRLATAGALVPAGVLAHALWRRRPKVKVWGASATVEAYHGFLFLGIPLGFYKEEGVDVEFGTAAGSAATLHSSRPVRCSWAISAWTC